MSDIEKIRERFAADRFATLAAGIEIEQAHRNYAKCSFTVSENHLNAAGTVMGGALFTLADFCFAVAANTDNPLTVSLNAAINFHGAAEAGTKLIAEANCVKSGKNTCFFTVDIRDNAQKIIATVSCTGFKKSG